MRIRPRPDGRETIVTVSGDVDLTTAGELARVVGHELLHAPVRLDLSEVSFIDSSGLRALDGLARHSGGGGLRLDPNLSLSVAQLLKLTGMMDVLPFAEADGPR